MKLHVRMEEQSSQFAINFKETDTEFPLCMRDIQTITKTMGEPYEGEYVVNPAFHNIYLPTENKYMRDDVTVKAIEVSKVGNIQGGNTVYIGGRF